ncbi:MAG: AAA family ATPase [Candidatus Lokiarchaeota archaeon]|nr:AAA family ATPase [Candidatus Lokiarchaeota archaeon]
MDERNPFIHNIKKIKRKTESKTTKNLIIFTGIPSSGKSTIAKLLAKELELKYNKKTMVIGSDQIRNMVPILEENFIPQREESIRKLTLFLVEKAIEFNDVVINDDMNYYKSMRHDFYQIAKRKKCNFFIIHFKISLEMALKWNKKRGTTIPQELIKEVFDKFDPLGSYEWDKSLSTIEKTRKTPEKGVAQIIEELKGRLDEPQFKSEEHSERNSPSIAEYYDKLTREIVSELIHNPEFESNRDQIIAIRKQILEKVIDENLDKGEIKEIFFKELEKQA